MELKGQIEDIVYSNETNGYTVCNMSVEDELITAVGYLPFVSVGDIILANGSFVNHAVYGEQFKIQNFEKVMPSSLVEIEKYLGSGIVKGIGPVTSKKIVHKFKEDTIQVLRFEPYKLAEIQGITNQKATQISQEFNEKWELWQIVLFLQKFKIGAANAARVYKEFGMQAIECIKENPYQLLNILYGVEFSLVDKMAISLGFEYNSSFRVSSGIKYALSLVSKNGSTCCEMEKLVTYVSTLLSVEEESVTNEIASLQFSKEIYLENGFLFLSNYFEAEDSIASRIMMMCNDKVKQYSNLDERMERVERRIKIDLSKEQKEAVKLAFHNRISIITGGPGTGKTTIIKTMIQMMQEEGLEIALCAPTGRAAKRMTETTGEEAKTLHRLLSLGKLEEDGISVAYEVSKIDKDVVIIDEASMMDTILFHFVVKSLLSKTRLVLIGDSDQLPSVGPRKCFKRFNG